jgi:hypothetical protein
MVAQGTSELAAQAPRMAAAQVRIADLVGQSHTVIVNTNTVQDILRLAVAAQRTSELAAQVRIAAESLGVAAQ